MMFKFKSLSHLIEGRKSWSHFCAVQSGSRWLIKHFSMTGNEVSPEQHGMDPITESCVILLLLRLYLPQPLAVAPLLPLFSEVELHALHQY